MGNIEQALSKMMEKSQICSGVLGNINVILGFLLCYEALSLHLYICTHFHGLFFLHYSLMNRNCLLSTLPLA